MQYSGRSSAFENRFLPLCFFTALFWRFSDKEIGTEENLCPDPLKKKMKIRKKDIKCCTPFYKTGEQLSVVLIV